MGAFNYLAIKKNGSSCKGVIEADSQWHARQLLREQGLFPTQVMLVKKHTSSKHSGKLSAQDLCLLTRQLATLIAAGIPLDEAITGVSEQSAKDKTRNVLIGLRSKVMEGYSLADAMGTYPQAFPELYRATVAAGEQTGRLDLILEHLANYTEAQQANRQRVIQALIYPLVMLSVSFGIIVFLLTFVVPKIIDVFNESGQTLPNMTLILIHISTWTKHYGLYLLVFLTILLIAFVQGLRTPSFKSKWQQFKLKLPLISKLEQFINLGRYIHTFSMLFAAGVSVLDTMRVSSSVLSNIPIANAFNIARQRVQEGTPIHQALKDTGYLPPMTAHLIASGEKSGQLSTMMERAANQLDNEVKTIIETGLTLLEPLIILLMGGVVLFIVLATLLPIFSMEQLVG